MRSATEIIPAIPLMQKTLRRSCEACAKAKHRCDLQTPTCSRCIKRNRNCIYINEPLTSRKATIGDIKFPSQSESMMLRRGSLSPNASNISLFMKANVFDPFDSYPLTSLPRQRVQGLMQHFLSKIAFRYYPLDLDPSSNPFITSWWPLALTDAALFHVTLQTASLDNEFHAGKGFFNSELLMKDSLSLLRHKIQDSSLAFQDATMNAVVTLAAIEHGKGNLRVSMMHIDGVKKMVTVRGGLSKIKKTSPLTARMVPWVSLLVTGSPQFDTQDDFGNGDGISTVKQWQGHLSNANTDPDLLDLDAIGLNPALINIINRLRSVFGTFISSQNSVNLSATDLHDLTSFTLHRLLSLPRLINNVYSISECLRYGVSIYMFIIHGPTYYSHLHVLDILVSELQSQLTSLSEPQESLFIWLLLVGAAASAGMNSANWFREKVVTISVALDLHSWDSVEIHLRRVLWLKTRSQVLFRSVWEEIISSDSIITVARARMIS